MSGDSSNPFLVLGLAPSARGVGFALMEGPNTLLDWGIKTVKGDKNARCLSKVADLITHYEPNVIALEDASPQGSRRSSRIQALMQNILALAEHENLKVKRFSRKQVRFGNFTGGRGTKHAFAASLAARFPEELGFRLPRKREPWMSEDSRMDMFDAVALAEHYFRHQKVG